MTTSKYDRWAEGFIEGVHSSARISIAITCGDNEKEARRFLAAMGRNMIIAGAAFVGNSADLGAEQSIKCAERCLKQLQTLISDKRKGLNQ